MRLMLLAVIAVTAMLRVQAPAVAGMVIDATDRAIPGATVRISGAGVSSSVVSDAMGRFRIGDLANGRYVLTVSLAGFRTQALNVQIDSSSSPELIVRLATGILSELLWVVPQPADAYLKAAAIAHLRIDRTRPPGLCGDAHVVTSRHEASVLRVFKGRLPPAIQLYQEAAGRCSERGQWHDGIERAYRPGEEYVVFLTERTDGFGHLAGRSLAFPVNGELVSLGGFAGVQGSISITELSALLDRLSRNAPPNLRAGRR